MASSGSFTTTACEGRSLTFSWSIQSQSTTNNTTIISWNLKGSGSYSGYVMGGPFTVTINGSTVYSSSNRIEVWAGNTKTTTVASGTTTITHNSDGTKSFSASVSAAIYSYSVNCSGSGSWALTTIPRASVITSASSVTLGNKCGITFTPASASFYYNIKFSLGSWSASTGLFCPKQTTAYTYNSYTIPANDTLYKLIPNSASGTMTATLTTYSSNSTSAQVGSASSKTFTVTVPSNVVPTVGEIKLTPQTYSYLIQGKNKLKVEVSGCSPGAGSSIKSYTFSGPGVSSTTTSTSVTSGLISNTGTLTYTVKVTDARGRTASKTKTITCYAHSSPSITLNAYRVASSTGTTANNSGTYVRCAYNLSYASVNNTNDVTVKIYYKKSTAGTWSSVTALNDSKNTSGSYTLSSIDAASTYLVYATITDNYSGTSSYPSATKTIFGAERILNITKDGTGVAFGKMAESSKLLESKYIVKAPGLRSSRNGRNNKTLDIVADNEHVDSLEYYITKKETATSAPGDGHVIHCHWDNTDGWDSQIHLMTNTGEMRTRGCNAGTWGDWRVQLDSSNYATLLYGRSTGSYGPITLAYDINNFSYIEIYYMDNQDAGKSGLNCTKFIVPKKSSSGNYVPNCFLVELSCIEASTTAGAAMIRTSVWTFASTSLTHARSKYISMKDGQVSTITDMQYIKVVAIVGYK